VPNAKDVTPETEWLKAFVVGDYGMGKSIFASTFPKPGFIFDFGNGILSYQGLDFDYEQYLISPLGWDKFDRDLPIVKKAVSEGKYQTVIVDDLSALTDVAMEKALQLDPKRSPTNGPIWNIHYQMVRNLVEGKVNQIASLNCNIVMIAHMQIVTDSETGAVVDIEPMLTGQLSVKVPGKFDEVYYATTRREDSATKWYMQTVTIGFKKARSRLSGVNKYLDDLVPNNYDAVMNMLKERRAKKRAEIVKAVEQINIANTELINKEEEKK
jgi:hypothetical protein